MPLNKDALKARIISQIDTLIGQYQEKYKSRRGKREYFPYEEYLDLSDDEKAEETTRFLAAIKRLAPPDSIYVKNAEIANTQYTSFSLENITGIIGVLKALRADYEAGYLETVTELIHADLFSDFLEMSKYLIDEGYKDPAAVVSGSVLEEHLRKLCLKNGLPIENVTPKGNEPLKASKLNDDLKSAGVYDKLEQSSVLSWLHIRNSAAHGKYGDYQEEQVKLMIQGIEAFLLRHPA